MRHFTHVTTWLEDEDGEQREFELGVNVEVYDEDDVQFRGIEYAFECNLLVYGGTRPGQRQVPVDQLPKGAADAARFEVEERKREIHAESREPEPDYHHDPRWEEMQERRH